jgi:hypothetical protein
VSSSPPMSGCARTPLSPYAGGSSSRSPRRSNVSAKAYCRDGVAGKGAQPTATTRLRTNRAARRRRRGRCRRSAAAPWPRRFAGRPRRGSRPTGRGPPTSRADAGSSPAARAGRRSLYRESADVHRASVPSPLSAILASPLYATAICDSCVREHPALDRDVTIASYDNIVAIATMAFEHELHRRCRSRAV